MTAHFNNNMFRPLARTKQELSEKECQDILIKGKRGVLSLVGDEGYPYGVPLNHYYDPMEGKLYFHSGKSGHKIDAMKKEKKASFCVIDKGHQEKNEWFLRFNSVIVFGKIEFIEDEEVIIDKSRELTRKFTDDDEYFQHELETSLKNTAMFALNIEHLCGKRIKEE